MSPGIPATAALVELANTRNANRGHRITELAVKRLSELDSPEHHSRVVDAVLDDSFPASDPPSWTGGISRVMSS